MHTSGCIRFRLPVELVAFEAIYEENISELITAWQNALFTPSKGLQTRNSVEQIALSVIQYGSHTLLNWGLSFETNIASSKTLYLLLSIVSPSSNAG